MSNWATQNAAYTSFNAAYKDLIRLVIDNGKSVTPRKESSLGATRELLNVCFTIPSTKPMCTWKARKMSYPFAMLEPFYLFTNQRVTDIAAALMYYAPNLKELALNEDTGNFDGNYGDRIHLEYPGIKHTTYNRGCQLRRCYNILKRDPDSRRAVVTIHNPVWDIVDSDSKDIPCTLSLQFLIRENKLHCFATMRGNDIWYGTPHNVMMFTFLQRAMAGWLAVDAGDYCHRTSNLHIYESHVEKARAMLKDDEKNLMPETVSYPCHPEPEDTYDAAMNVINLEKKMREESATAIEFPAHHSYEKLVMDTLIGFHNRKQK